MTNTTYINEAAALIAEFSVGAADIFRHQPFNRAAIAKAFESGFNSHTAYTTAVVKFVRAAVLRDQLERGGA
jgi:hypothetical protein